MTMNSHIVFVRLFGESEVEQTKALFSYMWNLTQKILVSGLFD